MIVRNLTHIKRLNFLQTRDCYTLFDGTNDFVDVSNNQFLINYDWTSPISIFVWHYKVPNETMPVLGNFRGSPNPLGWFLMGIRSGIVSPVERSLRFQLRSQALDVIDAYSQLKMVDNAWNFIGIAYGGTGQGSDIQFYINRVASPQPNFYTQGTQLVGGSIINGEAMTIGALPHPSVSLYGQGNLQHLSFFSRKVTLSEQESMFDQGRISPNYYNIPNLEGHYTLRNFDFQDRIGGTFGTPSGMTSGNNIICS